MSAPLEVDMDNQGSDFGEPPICPDHPGKKLTMPDEIPWKGEYGGNYIPVVASCPEGHMVSVIAFSYGG